MSYLPEFPTDGPTLDLLEAALTTPGPEGGSSLLTTLDLLAGLDPDEREFDRVSYHPNDVILALIAELREARGE